MLVEKSYAAKAISHCDFLSLKTLELNDTSGSTLKLSRKFLEIVHNTKCRNEDGSAHQWKTLDLIVERSRRIEVLQAAFHQLYNSLIVLTDLSST